MKIVCCDQMSMAQGCNVNGLTDRLSSPLHLAYANSVNDVVEILLEHGANEDLINIEGKIPKELSKRAL